MSKSSLFQPIEKSEEILEKTLANASVTLIAISIETSENPTRRSFVTTRRQPSSTTKKSMTRNWVSRQTKRAADGRFEKRSGQNSNGTSNRPN